MDKKNTMLLTVIAVATLLVAVVGATFAYFNVTANNNTASSPTVIQGTSETVGTVALNMGKQLHLDISAEDMSQAGAGTTKLYSTTEGTGNRKSPTSDPIVSAAVTGGETETQYSCEFTLKAELDAVGTDGNGNSMTFSKGEASLHLEGDNDAVVTTTDFDLSEIEETNTTKVTFNIAGSNTENYNVVKGYVVINNTAEQQQTTLAGKKLNVKLTSTDFSCKTANE